MAYSNMTKWENGTSNGNLMQVKMCSFNFADESKNNLMNNRFVTHENSEADFFFGCTYLDPLP